MPLQQSIHEVFSQLALSLDLLTDDQYVYAGKLLSNASIGQHVRHIIEMFDCLEEGYAGGIVNYEKRKRDCRIETDKAMACLLMQQIENGLDKKNKMLILEAVYHEKWDEPIQVETNYYREMAYNLEHTIHHMALIKVGLQEITAMAIPENFGVAPSTIKFRATCVQ